MKRILQINGHAIMNRGVEKFLLDVYKEIDTNNYQFDFMTPLECYNDEFRSTVESLGGKIIEMQGADNKVLNKLIPFKIWWYLMKHPYQIVHIHTGNVILMALFVTAAKLARTEKVFAHAHNSANMRTGMSKKSYKNYVADKIMLIFCDGYFACSHKAAKFMFPKKIYESNQYQIIPNGIDIKRYCFDSTVREKLRKRLGIESEIVLGCVGAFVSQKNHDFLIKIMKLLEVKKYNAILLLIGEGVLLNKIKNLCRIAGLEDKVIFWGTSDNIPEFLSAMDILVMPSLYEGFPIVGVEAQAAGLNCLLSTEITSEIVLTNTLVQLPIHTQDAVEIWVKEIMSMKINSYDERVEINHSMLKGDYHINNSAKMFEKIYSM